LSRLLLQGTLAFVLGAGLGSSPALASTVVVPDAFLTVQLAIDSGADTVLIREGTYAERPVVDHPVILQGIGIGQRPRLAGLDINNSYFFPVPPLLSVSRIDFAGPVEYATLYVHPRELIFDFSDCSLDSGFYQVSSLDPDDVASLTIRNCKLGTQSQARAFEVLMDADTIDAGVSWDTHGVSILNCWFRGGSLAIELTDTPRGTTAYNRIENYATAIFVDSGDPYTIESNAISRCETGIHLRAGSTAYVINNEIRDCGVGLDAIGLDELDLLNNSIVGSTEAGVTMSSVALFAEHNVVGKCGGSGFFLIAPQATALLGKSVIRDNTVFDNGGSGIAVTRTLGYPISVEGNISFGNVEWGLSVPLEQPIELGCNDWFRNGLGAVDGLVADSTDVSVDPLFCNVDSADVRLESASPLVDVPGCGQIGALGVGCGMTATLVQRFTADRVSDGILIVWKVAEGATASEVWLERSEGENGEAWTRPLTERSIENTAVVELDRSALADRAYRYRLVAREGSDAAVIGSAIVVEAQTRLEFRLVQVAPSPGSGPVRIAFALREAASIEIDVFDVQGRRIATPAHGTWPAGTHLVEWDGRTRNGEIAPSGLYLLGYMYPGGQDRRRLVHMP